MTGVQTCALPICEAHGVDQPVEDNQRPQVSFVDEEERAENEADGAGLDEAAQALIIIEIGRASCRERV